MVEDELAVVAGVVAGARGGRRVALGLVESRGHTARIRERGGAMVSLVDSVAAAGLEATISVVEAGGVSWTINLTSPRPATEVQAR